MNENLVLEEYKLQPGMGTIIASGVLRGIKGSKLSSSEIFLRETVQNSYDARKIGSDGKKLPLKYTMRGFRASNEQYKNIVSLMSGKEDKNYFFKKYIKKNLCPDMFNIEVSDMNTFGLIGDIEPSEKVGNQNFTNFVYFTGNDKKKDIVSGGSYGFGKAALYAYSKARTIAIYTRISKVYSQYESRFIVVANEDRIEDSASDRCWWGRIKKYSDHSRGVFVSPIIGESADELAESFGMLRFGSEETGTRLLVLNAGPSSMPKDFTGSDITIERLFKDYMPKYIVHWYWNHIYWKDIEFSLILDDEIVHIDNPEEVFPYYKFINAYKEIKENRAQSFSKTKYYSPIFYEKGQPFVVGYVGISKSSPMPIRYKDYFDVFSSTEPIVAYMRGIGHIVYYERFQTNAASLKSTCYGVFRASINSALPGKESGSVDGYFRQVENQTHDKWVHNSNISRYNCVRTVTSFIKDMMLNMTEIEQEDVKVSNISVIIQRTLGAKLMRYDKKIGGASASLPKESAQSQSKSKSTLLYSNTANIRTGNDGKIVEIQYKASVKEGKKIRINSITPLILSIDGDSIEDEKIIKFKSIEYSGKTRNSMVTRYIKLPMEIPYSLTCTITIVCKTDCFFDLKIDWEEV